MIRVRCSICDCWVEGESRADLPSFPFCSPRCKMIDLGRWLSGAYRIPVEDQEETPPAQADDPETP